MLRSLLVFLMFFERQSSAMLAEHLESPKPPGLMNGLNEGARIPEAASEEVGLTKMPSDDGRISPDEENKNDTQVCDALCSLSAAYTQPTLASTSIPSSSSVSEKRKSKSCPKQHQLPMFLSKTYHMIDRCDPEIATWSTTGDNFVVKNVEKFSSNVLPLYFKHSNFSSFARQLNFYGFRKLRTDPILTSDVNPRTSCYVRFYHDKFQKDRPELLHQIKRATKSEQQSKDEVESLKMEVTRLKGCVNQLNRRVEVLTSEYEKITSLITEILSRQQQPPLQGPQHRSQEQHDPQQLLLSQSSSSNAPDLMHSLSQVAAMSLRNHHLKPPLPAETNHRGEEDYTGPKRKVSDEEHESPSSRQKVS